MNVTREPHSIRRGLICSIYLGRCGQLKQIVGIESKHSKRSLFIDPYKERYIDRFGEHLGDNQLL